MSLLEGESKGGTDPTINKVVLMGDEGVGKTSMFLRFKTGRFVETTTSTRYQAEHYKEWTVRGTPVKMTLYDTAGMERYTATIPPTYFRHARAVLLVYSVDNMESIGSITTWAENFSKHRIGDNVNTLKVLLIGNKTDLNRIVSPNVVDEVAKTCGIPKCSIYEVSTKDNEGFDELFDDLAFSLTENPIERRKTIIATNDDKDNDKKKSLCSKCS